MKLKNRAYLTFSFLIFIICLLNLEFSAINMLVRDFLGLVIFKNVILSVVLVGIFILSTSIAIKKYKNLLLILNLVVLSVFTFRVYLFKKLYGYIYYDLFSKILFFIGVFALLISLTLIFKIFKEEQ